MHEKNPVLAAVLSFFFPGVGQIYNGDVGKGVVLLVADFVLVGFMFATFFLGSVF